jgi:hypothetical protein
MWKLCKKIQADLLQSIFNLIDKVIKYTFGLLAWGLVTEEEEKTILLIKGTLPEYSIQEIHKMTLRLKMQQRKENNLQVK